MGRYRFVKIALWCCSLMLVLVLTVGCSSGTASGESERPEMTEQSGAQSNSYLTVTEVSAVVLANAGLAEEDVRFVRFQLDLEDGISEYDIEFISADAQYDYTVNAVTGEILSMKCEVGGYDLNDIGQINNDQVNIDLGAVLQTPLPSGNPQSEDEGQYIGVEAARQIALKHAGLDDSDVGSVHAKLELEDGIWQYDVEFRQDNTEYDYDINAITGEILSFDHEAEYFHQGADDSGQITEDMARKIALDYAGVVEKDAQYMESKLDYDDGRAVYEVEWHMGQTEFSCDVDAATGEVLSFEKDFN
ncbi:MAG: PepSY domain-containing protein [bacterium]|nr:PepSY domain-containing protein [bacterium]MCM1374197.1 PepSY domain-containing protein [Muribaculum sp.]